MSVRVKTASHEHVHLSTLLLILFSVASGVTVANLYYSQPLLADIAKNLHASTRAMGIVSTLTQAGYAIGLFVFVPLGDMKERKRLIITMLFVVFAALIAVATAQNLLWLAVASLFVGAATIIPQLIIPLAAHLSPPNERGRVVGTVMSGLLVGILLARTASGFVDAELGWRAIYFIAAILMLLLVGLFQFGVPMSKPDHVLTYRQLFGSLRHLIVTLPVLRQASLMGAMSFGAFSVFWSTLVFFIQRPPYHYGAQVAGMFGLVGVAGALAAPIAGRLTDRISAKQLAGYAMLISLISYVCLVFFGRHMWGLILGVILLDLGVQATQISNQARIYALDPASRNRINTVYMVAYFVGGALGSYFGTLAWSQWGWFGVGGVGAGMLVLGILSWLLMNSDERNVHKTVTTIS